MNHPLVISPEARIEIAEAVGWYESQQPGLGRRFWQMVKERLRAICQHPELYPPTGGGKYRKTKVRKFPYLVYYRVKPEGIRALSVFHASQDPAKLSARLK